MGNKLPADWLDDPEWEMLRRKAENKPVSKELKQRMARQRPGAPAKREQPRAQAKREDTDKEVVVNLKLAIPKIKLPNFKKLARNFYQLHKRRVIIGGAALVVVVVAFGAFKLVSGPGGQVAGDSDTPLGQADFNPLVPLEGFTDGAGNKVPPPDVRFDKEKKILGYQSDYNESKLTISQQALPDQLKSNPGQIEGIARSVNANIPFDTQKGKAYLATDDETKAQVVVFATKEVLVFIRSSKELDRDEWTVYINQLTPEE